MQELDLLLRCAASARKVLARYQAAALAGTLEGTRLRDAQCDLGCPQCMLRCACALSVVTDIERQISARGGMTINGVSYAFAGRA